MFKKLLANLPFNPGLQEQLSFYIHRLNQETSLRRAGFIFIVLAFIVQLLVVLYPSENSLAASPASINQNTTNDQSLKEIKLSKTAVNLSKNIADSSGTKVSGGDVLQFNLMTQNLSNKNYGRYKAEDYIGDVLQYAEVINQNELKAKGIKLSGHNYLTWEEKLEPYASSTKVIRLKLKNSIPLTNSPYQGSTDYDCMLTNTYGNSVNIKVDCPLVKNLGQSIDKLPDTSPSSTIVISSTLALMSGYLAFRSRLLARELEFVRRSYSNSGGF